MGHQAVRTVVQFKCDGWCMPRTTAEITVAYYDHRISAMPKGWRRHFEQIPIPRPDYPVPDNDYDTHRTVQREYCEVCKRRKWPKKPAKKPKKRRSA